MAENEDSFTLTFPDLQVSSSLVPTRIVLQVCIWSPKFATFMNT